MKKIKLIFALFVSILCLCSCESAMNRDEQSEIDCAQKEVSISESAVDAVLSFVKEVYPQKYKTLSSTKEVLKPEFITNVSYEKSKFFAPTANNTNRELDTLLSIINFGDNEGFAIVSTKIKKCLSALFYFAILILISPVLVIISHLPPVVVLGTSTSPVSLLAINIFSERSVPLTSPVSFLTKISAASERSNSTSPVPHLILNFSVAITFFSLMSPVDISALRLPEQTTFVSFIPPVEVAMSISPVVISLTETSPVDDLILRYSVADALNFTSPVETLMYTV